MRLTPAQIGVRLICGGRLPPSGQWRSVDRSPLTDRLKMGREFLSRISGRDFGYDLAAWHEYLKESRDGGYTCSRSVQLPRVMKVALESEDWKAAVQQLTKQNATR